jgi:hypothetical protein
MARARVRPGHSVSEISDAIIAEWSRVLPPEGSNSPQLEMDVNALTAAFNRVLEDPCRVILDEAGKPIWIAVPLPPVSNRKELEDYLRNNGDFKPGMGAAVLFGCGH